MPLTMTDAVKNAEANALAALISQLSVHTGDPGLTGASEATGGSPAYARKAVSFNTAGTAGPLGGGIQPATPGVAWSSQVSFDLPAGSYTYWGAWGSSTFRVGNIFAVIHAFGAQDVLPFAIGIGPASGA